MDARQSESLFRWWTGSCFAMPGFDPLCIGAREKAAGVDHGGVSALRFHLLIAAGVWLIWLLVGGRVALGHIASDWRIAATMAVGSLVGGGTSSGGGAIAFPVFTKLLHIVPDDARTFSLAIQSVGMGAATLSILYLRIPIERRALSYAGFSGVIGVTLGTCVIAPHVPPAVTRALFTVLVTSMGIALILMNRRKHSRRNPMITRFESEEKAILCASGFVGGILSALIGTGENTVLFIVLVLLFRVNEKVVTPTTVILMTIVTVPGFVLHLLVHDVNAAVIGYWLAAVPVAVVMAPLGALICSYMERRSIVIVLLCLIALEIVSTFVLVPFTHVTLWAFGVAAVVLGALELLMSRSRRYLPDSRDETVAPGEGAAHFTSLPSLGEPDATT